MITIHDLDQLPTGPRLFAKQALIQLSDTGFWEQVLLSNMERLMVGTVSEPAEELATKILAYREFKSTVDSLSHLGQQLQQEQIDEQE